MTAPILTPAEMLARLVGFDTTSSKSNLELIDFVRQYLSAHGVASTLIPNDEGTKANLFATVGDSSRPGIGLSGHTDVVPVAGQDWSSDPFRLTERDGRLHGRGSCDMKGFLAVILALVPEMAAAKSAEPVHLLLSYDEEVGCTGVRPMIEAFGAQLIKPRLIIVGEPTGMRVVNAHKSAHSFCTEVTGHSAHSSMAHLGAGAIYAAAEIIGEIATIRDELIAAGDPSGRFTPPYSSIQIGRISGGTAINIVPRRCVVEWDMRGLPGSDPQGVLARVDRFGRERVLPGLRSISPDTDVTSRISSEIPGLTPEQGNPAEALSMELADAAQVHAVSYGTEAGLFQGAGVPSVICGPGSIEQAHKPDEYVAVDQLELCTKFIRRLIG